MAGYAGHRGWISRIAVLRSPSLSPFRRNGISNGFSGHSIGNVGRVKPILEFQIALLRLWADNIEAFARKYEKGLGAEVEQQERQQRMA
jgi:hypothetical protein